MNPTKVWARIFLGAILVVTASLTEPSTKAAPAVQTGTPVSPGGDTSFVFSQGLVLVTAIEGESYGVYRATDEGWHEIFPPSFSEMKATPDGTIYIYNSDSLYRSTDSGETWDLKGKPPYPSVFPSPMLDVVFSVAAAGTIGEWASIYKSTDGGKTWNTVLMVNNARAKWVAFSPSFTEDGTAFAALDAYHASVGIWKTEDWGETWVKKSNGLFYGYNYWGHLWVAVSPQYSQDQTVFTADASGIYKTTNGGESWFRVADFYMHRVALSPRYIEDQTILATDTYKLVLSQDGGETWELLLDSSPSAVGIRIPEPFESPAPPGPPAGPHMLYFPLVGHEMRDTMLEFWLVDGTYSSGYFLYRSYDLGTTWEEMFVYEPTHWYYFPTAFRNSYVPTWRPLGLDGKSAEILTVDPSVAGALYAGTAAQGLYKSTDAGGTWHQINEGLPDPPGVAVGIEFDASESRTAFAAVTHYPRFSYSQNGGDSWNSGGDIGRIPQVLSTHPVTSGRIFVGGRALPGQPGGEVYRSDDGGLSWQMVITNQVLATSIEASGSDPSLVYVGGTGLYRSQDGGDTFTQLAGLPFIHVDAVALHPTTTLTAYVATESGIFKTIDGGDNWAFLAADVVSELLVDPLAPEIMYAVRSCAGVYVSRDGGQQWQPMNAGLGNLCVNDLALDAASTHLYAATEDGVWVVSLSRGEE